VLKWFRSYLTDGCMSKPGQSINGDDEIADSSMVWFV